MLQELLFVLEVENKMKKNLALILTLPLIGCGAIPTAVPTNNVQAQPTPVKSKEEIIKDFIEALKFSQDLGTEKLKEAVKNVKTYADSHTGQTDELYKQLGELASEREKVLDAYAKTIEQLREKLKVYQRKE